MTENTHTKSDLKSPDRIFNRVCEVHASRNVLTLPIPLPKFPTDMDISAIDSVRVFSVVVGPTLVLLPYCIARCGLALALVEIALIVVLERCSRMLRREMLAAVHAFLRVHSTEWVAPLTAAAEWVVVDDDHSHSHSHPVDFADDWSVDDGELVGSVMSRGEADSMESMESIGLYTPSETPTLTPNGSIIDLRYVNALSGSVNDDDVSSSSAAAAGTARSSRRTIPFYDGPTSGGGGGGGPSMSFTERLLAGIAPAEYDISWGHGGRGGIADAFDQSNHSEHADSSQQNPLHSDHYDDRKHDSETTALDIALLNSSSPNNGRSSPSTLAVVPRTESERLFRVRRAMKLSEVLRVLYSKTPRGSGGGGGGGTSSTPPRCCACSTSASAGGAAPSTRTMLQTKLSRCCSERVQCILILRHTLCAFGMLATFSVIMSSALLATFVPSTFALGFLTAYDCVTIALSFIAFAIVLVDDVTRFASSLCCEIGSAAARAAVFCAMLACTVGAAVTAAPDRGVLSARARDTATWATLDGASPLVGSVIFAYVTVLVMGPVAAPVVAGDAARRWCRSAALTATVLAVIGLSALSVFVFTDESDRGSTRAGPPPIFALNFLPASDASGPRAWLGRCIAVSPLLLLQQVPATVRSLHHSARMLAALIASSVLGEASSFVKMLAPPRESFAKSGAHGVRGGDGDAMGRASPATASAPASIIATRGHYPALSLTTQQRIDFNLAEVATAGRERAHKLQRVKNARRRRSECIVRVVFLVLSVFAPFVGVPLLLRLLFGGPNQEIGLMAIHMMHAVGSGMGIAVIFLFPALAASVARQRVRAHPELRKHRNPHAAGCLVCPSGVLIVGALLQLFTIAMVVLDLTHVLPLVGYNNNNNNSSR